MRFSTLLRIRYNLRSNDSAYILREFTLGFLCLEVFPLDVVDSVYQLFLGHILNVLVISFCKYTHNNRYLQVFIFLF